MRFYSKQEAIKRMNNLAAAGKEFVFIIDYKQQRTVVEEKANIDETWCRYEFRGKGNYPTQHNKPDKNIIWNAAPPTFNDYCRSFNIVKRNIMNGNSYLTNLTCKVPIETNLTLEEIFRCSDAPYKLWLKDCFVCFSPETFIRIRHGKISSYPMKGTINGACPEAYRLLMEDKKEAAEHATIVDLIRNDLSMAASGVTVGRYRYCERLDTHKGPILQTSSEITGILPKDYRSHIGNIIFSQLPAGSITGAPKARTCKIIAEAEKYERGFYTGVAGIYDGNNLDSAVMIRFIEQEDGKLFYKAGGGITSQSRAENEYHEMIQKIYVPIY
ncbi:MAG: aminodeoxychorismate synthase component I [Bacteroides sp.]|nr:aminodeoxychorismate synthase component I [Roseburia sp.]MCM1346543.1 aminodeoxychorismate synthase component I [Bacteroides sp.]MCM1421083.1 aminodeoxychorismate synthase component I [Bacteroides sp.]